MAIFRKIPKWKLIREKHTVYVKSLVPHSGGFYDSSIRGKTYDCYLESIENRSVAGIRAAQQEQSGAVLVKKKTSPRNIGNK